MEKWDDYFKLFTRGQILFGNYIEHCVDWYKQINRPNYFFITYEEVKADHRGSVEKLAKFLEKVRSAHSNIGISQLPTQLIREIQTCKHKWTWASNLVENTIYCLCCCIRQLELTSHDSDSIYTEEQIIREWKGTYYMNLTTSIWLGENK